MADFDDPTRSEAVRVATLSCLHAACRAGCQLRGHGHGAAYKLVQRPAAPPLARWLVCFLGRDRSHDIAAARRDLGYAPDVNT